jgi:preprotein translocase subunit SecG
MSWIQISQIVISIFLIVVILLQNKGAALGSVFGGNSAVFLTKRGIEKKLFVLTIVLAVLFFANSIANLLLSR